MDTPGDNLLAPSHGKMNSASLALDTLSHFNIDLAARRQRQIQSACRLGQRWPRSASCTHQSAPAIQRSFRDRENNGGSPVNGYFLGFRKGASSAQPVAAIPTDLPGAQRL